MKKRRLTTRILALGLLVFLIAGLSGVAYTRMEMSAPMSRTSDMGQTAPMQGCLFIGILHPNTSCGMNAFAHIVAWQSVFVSVPNQDNTLIVLFLLFAAVLGALSLRVRDATVFGKILFRARRQYQRTHTLFATQLQEAFSNGIINPKIF